MLSEQEEQDSLARVQAGGIPLAAERRLKELSQRKGAFTSDLSVADFALCDRLGLRPLSQVMGSSVYQIGYQGQLYGYQLEMTELSTLSAAWNDSRDLAFARLAQEAASVGAAAVVGVDVRSSIANWAEAGGYGAIEYAINGTAVARDGHRSGQPPVITELSVADYAKLLSAGIEPVGIVAWTSVFFVSSILLRTEQAPFGGALGAGAGAFQSFEYGEVTQCFYGARERVMSEVGAQAQTLGASGIVGVRIAHTIRSGSLQMGVGIGERPGLIASFSAIGTAVSDRGKATPPEPKPTIDLTAPASRRRGRGRGRAT